MKLVQIKFVLITSFLIVNCLPQKSPIQQISGVEGGNTGNANIDTKNKDMNKLANDLVSIITPDEANTISTIMKALMPSMFGLFSNITSDDYKANFKDPCRFDVLMDIFKNLPPYFDIISNKYPTKPDLAAYYSMQLASTFLVNNGSLTMSCLYNMLSLQTRLMNFSLDIMDNPENNPQLVGLFGIFMKPVMGMLKKNSMMKIIEHVDRYDKNDDFTNVTLFNFLNVIYCFVGLIGILSNVFLVILLKRSSSVVAKHRLLSMQKIQKAKQLESQKMIQMNSQYGQSQSHQKLQSNLSSKSKIHCQDEKPEMRSKKRVINSAEVAVIDKDHRTPKIKDDMSIAKIKSTRSNKNGPNNNRKHHHRSENRSKNRTHTKNSNRRRHRHNKNNAKSKYKLVKKTQIQLNYIIKKRYNTRICFIIIAICHSLYILMNFIIMSQASIAAMALQSLSQLNFACKISFMLFPPTTAYTIIHQLAIWLLVYSIRQHGIKLRTTSTHNIDEDADYEVNLIKNDLSDNSDLYLNDSDDCDDDSSSNSDDNEDMVDTYEYHKGEIYNSYDEESNHEEDDTVSQSLTNNSQPSSSKEENNGNAPMVSASTLGFNGQKVQFMENNVRNNTGYPIISQQQQPLLPASFHIMSTNPYNPNMSVAIRPNQNTNAPLASNKTKKSNENVCCNCISQKKQNIVFCIVLGIFLFIYNSQNLFFYSLSELKAPTGELIYYCAFDQGYAEYYSILNQYIVPMLNLILFAALPLTLCTMQVLFDVCFLVRVKREQMKRYLKLRDIIEWPLYIYYLVYMISQLPFAIHQVNDLIMGTVKFPFVFPLFIQLKFTSKVWLTVMEMTLIFLACCSDLYIWIFCDKELRQLAKYWLNKRILCRTYARKSSHKSKKKLDVSTSLRSCSGSSSQSDSNSLEISERNNNNNNAKKNPAISSTSTAMTGVQLVPSSANQINGYASSTLSSTSSSLKKKPISPIVTESIKATAALSAASTQQSISNDIFDPSLKLNSPVIQKQQAIRMIDTDNEDIDMANDPNEPNRLNKLDEEKLDTSINNYEKYPHPPSFKTAISSRPLYNTNNIYSQNPAQTEYRNPYQNDIDLNIHPNMLPKIQYQSQH